MNKFLFIISTMMYSILLTSCVVKSTNAENWKNPFSGSFEGINKDYYLINQLYLQDVISILDKTSYYKLSQDELFRLTGIVDTKSYYCCRAIYSIKGGKYIVQRNINNDLQITYVVLSRRKKSINKDALVIQLDEVPNKIYVTETSVQ